MKYDFRVVLAGASELTDEMADALFVAGCDDGTPVSRDCVDSIVFTREAESLEAAIRSAVANVQAAGCTVAKVEIPADEFAAVS